MKYIFTLFVLLTFPLLTFSKVTTFCPPAAAAFPPKQYGINHYYTACNQNGIRFWTSSSFLFQKSLLRFSGAEIASGGLLCKYTYSGYILRLGTFSWPGAKYCEFGNTQEKTCSSTSITDCAFICKKLPKPDCTPK